MKILKTSIPQYLNDQLLTGKQMSTICMSFMFQKLLTNFLFYFYFVLFYLRKPRLSHFLHACLKNKKWRCVPHSAAVLAGQLSESIFFHMHLVKPLLIIESLWLSGRALKREFRRFDVWFLVESQNYIFLSPTLETRKMNMFLHNFYIYLSYFLCSSYHS